jgi:hypothetical protein
MVSSTEAFPGKGAATWITISTPEEVLVQDKRIYLAQFTMECTSEVVLARSLTSTNSREGWLMSLRAAIFWVLAVL